MTHEEEEAKAAIVRFYDALEDLLRGKGSGPMSDAWHHTPRVTSGHPWETGRTAGTRSGRRGESSPPSAKRGNAGGKIRDLKVIVYGDVAYSTRRFHGGTSARGNADERDEHRPPRRRRVEGSAPSRRQDAQHGRRLRPNRPEKP